MGHSIALFIRTPSPPATSVCPTDYYNLLIPFIFFHLERLLHSDVFPSIDVGTLYIRRRNQLLRENAKKEVLLFYYFYSFIVYFYSTWSIFSSLMMLSIGKSLDLNFNFLNCTLRLHQNDIFIYLFNSRLLLRPIANTGHLKLFQKADHSCRRQYLYLRRQLLSKRYGPSESSLSR